MILLIPKSTLAYYLVHLLLIRDPDRSRPRLSARVS